MDYGFLKGRCGHRMGPSTLQKLLAVASRRLHLTVQSAPLRIQEVHRMAPHWDQMDICMSPITGAKTQVTSNGSMQRARWRNSMIVVMDKPFKVPTIW